jgi:Fe2+ transport system protein FeoA
MQRLQQTETYLDAEQTIAMVDLVSSDTIAADVYMALEREDYRKVWIAKRLMNMGFVEGATIGL